MYIDALSIATKQKLKDLQVYLVEKIATVESDALDMKVFYCELEDENGEVCGSRASVIGWLAMMLGHSVGYDGVDMDDGTTLPWHVYTRNVLDIADLKARRVITAWLDYDEWSAIDNTIDGAVKRISYLLTHGVPDDFIESDSDEEHDYVFTREGFKRGFEAYSAIA